MSYCAQPVYFRPGSVCINTQARQEEAHGGGEVEGGEGTKEPNLQGHPSKIENVNNETRERRIHNLEFECKRVYERCSDTRNGIRVLNFISGVLLL